MLSVDYFIVLNARLRGHKTGAGRSSANGLTGGWVYTRQNRGPEFFQLYQGRQLRFSCQKGSMQIYAATCLS